MREIKFRAWDRHSKKMINCGIVEDDFSEFNSFLRYELMQYTGLEDKNGKEIYEGDIIETARGFSYIVKDIRLDTLKLARGIKFHKEHKDTTNFEVIGNIYKNPELMKDV